MAKFRPNTPIAIGSNPVSNATADLNGDGHLDLLFTNYQGDSVSVLYGDGIGGFTAGTGVAASNPREIMVGDLDRDGDIDFIATNLAGNSVTVALNNRDGTFTLAAVPVESGPRGLGLGDLDGDGDLDFVSANYGSNTLSVMLNNGNGTFTQQAGSPLATGGSRPVQMVMSDFDGDGKLDLAVTNNSNNNVGILLGNGDGTFKAPTLVSTGAGPRGLTAGDLNGDGKSDLVVGDFNGGGVSILLSNGDGTFAARTSVATGNNPYDVKLGDLDGDGDLDMVVSNSGSSSLSVFFNNGAGVFVPASGSPFAVGVSPGGLTLGDFDHDGDLDISSTNFGSNTTSILINTMARYSVKTSAVPFPEGTAPGAGGELVFIVTRTATSEAETVTYKIGGTATAGSDYLAPSGTVSFAVGQKTAEIRISITPDFKWEVDESVILTLTGVSGDGSINPAATSATSTIADDDVNNAPVLTGDLAATVKEGGSYTLLTADLYFTDPDEVAANVTFTVSTLSNGKLLVNGVEASTFTGAELAAGKVSFVHNGSETTSASFRVTVEDGNEDNSAPVASTFNFTVTPVNDAPKLTGDLAATVNEGASYRLTSADLYFTDPDDVPADVTFTVSTLSNGKLLVDGAEATSFTGAELAAGKVTFVHDGSETTSASFRIVVEDGNEDNSAPVTSTFNFTVPAVNVPPVLTGDLKAAVKEGGSYTLTTADLNFTDPDDAAADVTFTVSALSNGKLLVDGVQASTFTGAELAAGKVTFVHDGSEATKVAFKVFVEDGNEDGSTPVARTFDFTVKPVNDAPVLTGDLKAAVREGGSYTLTTADLNFSDPDDSAAGVRFTVSGAVAGKLLVNGTAATSFTGAELAAGKVTFVHDGSETTKASFRVFIEDGNEDKSTPVAKTFNLAVTPVNDAAKLGARQVLTAIAEDASTASARKVADLSVVDPDGGSNKLSLVGSDSKLFEIKNGALWLKKGATLDFETNPTLDVTVRLDDPTIGTSYEAAKAFRVAVKDVNDVISGTPGNDTLSGTSANDVLDGKAGNDVIKGGAGNDTLIGGTGIDLLTGGAGRDTFVFATAKDSAPGYTGFVNNGGYSPLSGAAKRDIVTDFVRGEDRLDVSKIDADLKLAGDQAFVWRGTGDFSGKVGELIVRTFDVKGTANDRTIVYGDVNRDGRADFQIELAGILTLTKGDFLL